MNGKHHSDEAKTKISTTQTVNLKNISRLYNSYKENGGTLKWNDFQSALKSGNITNLTNAVN